MLKRTRDGRVLRLTLARPEKRNALDSTLSAALLHALQEANQDPTVGAMLLDAEGPVFSAGMDLDEAPNVDARALGQVHVELFAIRAGLTKPLVAAVNGSAFGGGLGLVANAHVVVASEDAQFGLTELRVGMWPFTIWASVAGAIGERRAIELALTSRLIDAREAHGYALVHHVLPSAQVAVRADELAQQLAQSSGEAMARGLRAAANPALALELRVEQAKSGDFQEGVAAFREKRAPKWPSHDAK